MRISEALEIAVTAGKFNREQIAIQQPGYPDAAHGFVSGWRGDTPFGWAMLSRHDRDALLYLVRIFAAGFSCDVIALTNEAWFTALNENPMTGERWGEQEMQSVVDNHNGRAKGWIQDSLSITVVNRAGDLAMQLLPFRIEGNRVIWDEPQAPYLSTNPSGTFRVSGIIPETMIKSMSIPEMDTRQDMPDVGHSFTQRRAFLDSALVESLGESPYSDTLGPVQIVLFIDTDDRERFDVLRKSLRRDQRARPNPDMN